MAEYSRLIRQILCACRCMATKQAYFHRSAVNRSAHLSGDHAPDIGGQPLQSVPDLEGHIVRGDA
jgi:hypothetical protein